MHKLTLLSVFCGALGTGCVSGHSAQITWTHTLSEAKAEARPGNKLIITDLYTDWCGWCKVMDSKTWPDPMVVRESGRYVFLKLNAETEEDGRQLAARLNIHGFPTTLILDANGDEFERLEGYLPAAQFLAKLEKAVEDPDALGNVRAQQAAHPEDPSILHKLGEKLVDRSSYLEAQRQFEQIVRLDPQNKSRLTDSALFYIAFCQANRFSERETSLTTLDRLRKTFPESSFLPRAHLFSCEVLIRLGLKEQARARLREFLKIYPQDELAGQAKQLLEML